MIASSISYQISLQMAKATSPWQIYFYIPNIIGYMRVLFCALSYYFAMESPNISLICYFFGQGMDALDGVAARYFDQCSRFGALLDMLTDRMGTCVLFIVISHLYPGTWGWAAFLIVLDTTSHWYQMYVTYTQGKTTHKGSSNALLNFYYTGKHVLLVMCCGNELFIMSIYYMAFYPTTLVRAVAMLCFPIFLFKQFMNVVQLLHNVHQLVLVDVDVAGSKDTAKTQ